MIGFTTYPKVNPAQPESLPGVAVVRRSMGTRSYLDSEKVKNVTGEGSPPNPR